MKEQQEIINRFLEEEAYQQGLAKYEIANLNTESSNIQPPF